MIDAGYIWARSFSVRQFAFRTTPRHIARPPPKSRAGFRFSNDSLVRNPASFGSVVSGQCHLNSDIFLTTTGIVKVLPGRQPGGWSTLARFGSSCVRFDSKICGLERPLPTRAPRLLSGIHYALDHRRRPKPRETTHRTCCGHAPWPAGPCGHCTGDSSCRRSRPARVRARPPRQA